MSQDPQPSPRLRAIAAYQKAIHDAVRIAAERNDPDYIRRIKRRLARGDLFFLLVYVLGRKDVNHDWVFARCREVQLAPNGYLDL